MVNVNVVLTMRDQEQNRGEAVNSAMPPMVVPEEELAVASVKNSPREPLITAAREAQVAGTPKISQGGGKQAWVETSHGGNTGPVKGSQVNPFRDKQSSETNGEVGDNDVSDFNEKDGEVDPDELASMSRKQYHARIAKRHDPLAVKKQDWGMVHPMSQFMRYWDLITLFLLLYTATVTPYEVAFVPDDPFSPMYFLNMIINLCFLFDLFLNFNLMYFDDREMKMVARRSKVAFNYLKGFFLIDFVSILPYDDISTATGSGGNLKILRVVRIARLAKLLRILRSSRIFQRFENSMTINYGALKLFKFIVATAFIAHWMACVWHLVKVIEDSHCNWVDEYYHGACGNPIPNDAGKLVRPSNKTSPYGGVPVWSKYFTSLYLSVMTISTVGYGDVTPQTEGERIYLIFAMLLGASVYAYVVGSICSIIASMNMRETEFQELMDSLNTFIQEAKISQELSHRLRAFFRYRRHTTSFKSWHGLLQMMSPSMRGEVAMQLNQSWMSNVKYFKGIPQGVSIELSFAFTLETYPPEEEIISEDDESNKLFVLKQGIVICRGVVKSTHGVIGDDMMWRTRQRGYRAVTITFCDTYCLSASSMQKVMSEYPSVRKHFRQMAVVRIVCEKIVYAAKLVRSLSGQMDHWQTRGMFPSFPEVMDYIKSIVEEDMNVTFKGKLFIVKMGSAKYFEALERHACFLQRIYRGHQARKFFNLKKQARSKGIPDSLLNRRNMTKSKSMMAGSVSTGRLAGIREDEMQPEDDVLSVELEVLKEQLISSMHAIIMDVIKPIKADIEKIKETQANINSMFSNVNNY